MWVDMDRQTDGRTDRDGENSELRTENFITQRRERANVSETDTDGDRQGQREGGRQTDRQKHREGDRDTERQRDGDTQKDREMETHKKIERWRHIGRERDETKAGKNLSKLWVLSKGDISKGISVSASVTARRQKRKIDISDDQVAKHDRQSSGRRPGLPNNPYGHCGRKATLEYNVRAQELRESRGWTSWARSP